MYPPITPSGRIGRTRSFCTPIKMSSIESDTSRTTQSTRDSRRSTGRSFNRSRNDNDAHAGYGSRSRRDFRAFPDTSLLAVTVHPAAAREEQCGPTHRDQCESGGLGHRREELVGGERLI